NNLEGELGRKLQRPGAPASKEGVADADVAGGRQPKVVFGGPVRIDAVRGRVGDKRGQQRAREVRGVQQVVGLEAELQLQVLGDRGVLEDGEVELPEVRSDQRVAAFVTEVHGVAGGRAVEAVLREHVDAVERAGDGEGRQIQEVPGIARVVDRGDDV